MQTERQKASCQMRRHEMLPPLLPFHFYMLATQWLISLSTPLGIENSIQRLAHFSVNNFLVNLVVHRHRERVVALQAECLQREKVINKTQLAFIFWSTIKQKKIRDYLLKEVTGRLQLSLETVHQTEGVIGGGTGRAHAQRLTVTGNGLLEAT